MFSNINISIIIGVIILHTCQQCQAHQHWWSSIQQLLHLPPRASRTVAFCLGPTVLHTPSTAVIVYAGYIHVCLCSFSNHNYLFELLRSLFISRVLVRMILHSKFPETLLAIKSFSSKRQIFFIVFKTIKFFRFLCNIQIFYQLRQLDVLASNAIFSFLSFTQENTLAFETINVLAFITINSFSFYDNKMF